MTYTTSTYNDAYRWYAITTLPVSTELFYTMGTNKYNAKRLTSLPSPSV